MYAKKQKIISSVSISVAMLLAPVFAFAAINPVPTSDSGSTLENSTFGLIFSPVVKNYQVCINAVQVFDKGDSATQSAFSGISVISGTGDLGTALGAEVAAYNSFITCAGTVITSLQNVPAPNLYTDNQKQQFLNQVKSDLATYKAKQVQAQARLNNANQGFWKTLVYKILIQTSKSVADALVTKLVNNYKIVDFKRYADSVATLVYDNQYIRDNFPSAQGQLMARAILEQPELRNQVPYTMFTAADAALGFDPKGLDPNDPYFYSKMASVGSASANPYFIHSSYVGGVDQAHNAALAQAQTQIAQSAGYKTPMNCAGSLSQQQAIDTQAKVLTDRLQNRSDLLHSLQSSPIANQSDLAKAQTDYNAAYIAWNNAPDAYSTTTNAAMVMCEAIASPVNLINKGIDTAFDSLKINVSQYNDNNLPGFMSLIGDVASQVSSSLIFGGPDAAKGAAIANESRAVNGAVTAINTNAVNKAAATGLNAVTFTATPDPSTKNGYTLSWNIDENTIPASYVKLVGDGILDSSTQLGLGGNYPIVTTKGGIYTLTGYSADGRPVSSTTLSLNNSGPFSYNNNNPSVLGAFTTKPSFAPRGPVVVLLTRGE